MPHHVPIHLKDEEIYLASLPLHNYISTLMIQSLSRAHSLIGQDPDGKLRDSIVLLSLFLPVCASTKDNESQLQTDPVERTAILSYTQ